MHIYNLGANNVTKIEKDIETTIYMDKVYGNSIGLAIKCNWPIKIGLLSRL